MHTATTKSHRTRAFRRWATVSHPYVVFRAVPGYPLVEVNDHFLNITHRRREDVLGQVMAEVFPSGAHDPDIVCVSDLCASLARVVCTGVPDIMQDQQYGLWRRTANGSMAVRYWRPVNSPVLDANSGTVLYIVHHMEQVPDGAVPGKASRRQGGRGDRFATVTLVI